MSGPFHQTGFEVLPRSGWPSDVQEQFVWAGWAIAAREFCQRVEPTVPRIAEALRRRTGQKAGAQTKVAGPGPVFTSDRGLCSVEPGVLMPSAANLPAGAPRRQAQVDVASIPPAEAFVQAAELDQVTFLHVPKEGPRDATLGL